MIPARTLALALVLLGATAARAQETAPLVAINQCEQRLSLLVSVMPENGQRQTHGWFDLPPKSDKMLYMPNGNPVEHKVSLPFYIYAANPDDTMTWTDTDLAVEWQGRTYNMQRRDLLAVDGTGPFVLKAVRFDC